VLFKYLKARLALAIVLEHNSPLLSLLEKGKICTDGVI